MKDGTLTFLLVLVAVFIIVTVVNVGYKAVNKEYVTETALASVGTDSETVKGVFVRDEKVITYGGKGVISYEVPDGGKLGIGSVIAKVYSTEEQIELGRHIRSLQNELALLERISNTGTIQTAQPSSISELFTENYKNFLYEREQGTLTDVQTKREELLVLLSTYQLVTGKDASYALKMETIQRELEELETQQEEPLDVIKADEAAYFVSYADGYEGQLDLESLDELTAQEIENIRDVPRNDNGVVGKLIDSYQWVLAAAVDNTDKIYQTGDRVTLKFSSTSETVTGTVTMVTPDPPDPTKTVIGITCRSMTYDLVQHRTETVEIIRGEYQGIMVPKDALHFRQITNEETGETENVRGVYILNGEQPEFRRVKVVYEAGDYLISAQTTDSDCLHLYDSIIMKGIDADGA